MRNDLERFKALSQSAQDAILDKHRDWNVDGGYDWWEAVYEQFIEAMKEVGIEVDTRTERTHKGKTFESPAICFSGFWSQGDGACFNGRVADWNLVLTLHDFPMLLEHREYFDTMEFRWYTHGNYCHEHTLEFTDNDSYPVFITAEHENLLRAAAAHQLEDELALEWERFKETYEEVVKSYCRKLYSSLEEEYDYLTSDACVLESLSANDMLNELIEEYENEELI